MKTLIAYASKTGTSKKCAELLGQALPDSELCDLTKEKRDPASFDAVVIAGVLGVMAAELAGEITERIVRGKKRPSRVFRDGAFVDPGKEERK